MPLQQHTAVVPTSALTHSPSPHSDSLWLAMAHNDSQWLIAKTYNKHNLRNSWVHDPQNWGDSLHCNLAIPVLARSPPLCEDAIAALQRQWVQGQQRPAQQQHETQDLWGTCPGGWALVESIETPALGHFQIFWRSLKHADADWQGGPGMSCCKNARFCETRCAVAMTMKSKTTSQQAMMACAEGSECQRVTLLDFSSRFAFNRPWL